MSLVTLNEVLDYAEKKKIAIPAFNIDNIEIPEAIMIAAKEEDCPVILTIGQMAIRAGGLNHLPSVVKSVAERYDIPVVLHLDHSGSYDQIVACIKAGFTSVMYDGSHGPFEENVKESQMVVRTAHAVGVSVECELGAIGGVEDGMKHDNANLVDLNEVERFIEKVDCDALAVGIGNAHGIYKATPNLDFDRIEACRKMGAPHLVLHGGSGIPDEMIKKAITLGIRKINVATEIRLAFMEGIKESVDSGDFYEMYKGGKDAVTKLAGEKIRLFLGK